MGKRFGGLEQVPGDLQRPGEARNWRTVSGELMRRFGRARGASALDRAITIRDAIAMGLARFTDIDGKWIGSSELREPGDPYAWGLGPRIVATGTLASGPSVALGAVAGGKVTSGQIDPLYADPGGDSWVYSAVLRCTELVRSAGGAGDTYIVQLPAVCDIESRFVVAGAGAATQAFDAASRRVIINFDVWLTSTSGTLAAATYTFNDIEWWLLRQAMPA